MTDQARRLAVGMSWFTVFGALAIGVTTILIWAFLDTFAEFAAATDAKPDAIRDLTVGGRFAGFAVAATGAAAKIYGLLCLRTTFLEAAADRPLSVASVEGFRRFAWVALLLVPLGVIQDALLSVIFSAGNPVGERQLDITLGSHDLQALFIGLLLVFAAHVFALGRQAQEDAASII